MGKAHNPGLKRTADAARLGPKTLHVKVYYGTYIKSARVQT